MYKLSGNLLTIEWVWVLFLGMRNQRIRPDWCAAYHCIARIVGGERLLGDRDKEVLRRMMWRQAEFCGVEIVTYCLMSNHVHLLIRVPVDTDVSDAELVRRIGRLYQKKDTWVLFIEQEIARTGKLSPSVRKRLLARMGDVSAFMKELKQRFSLWYNRSRKRFGTLWAERFKSVLIEDQSEALNAVAMYIDLNPVRAGLVNDPMEYRYCGYAEAVAGNRSVRKQLAETVGARDWRQGGTAYRRALMVSGGDESRADRASLSPAKVRKVLDQGGRLESGELLRLRVRYFSDGLVLGSREFVDRIFEEFRDRFGERRKSGARRIRSDGGALSGLCSARNLQVAEVG